MTYLLDTHALLWAILDDKRLSPSAKKLIENADIACYFSIVSLWEITIKHSLGALDLKMSLKECFDIIVNTGFTELPLDRQHLLELEKLPSFHKDPFDRALIAQAISSQLTIITKDSEIEKYTVSTFW